MHARKPASRRMVLPAAAMVAMLLAGCSSGHIGESWQCPLAKGGSCDSVAAADPAVPDTAGRTVLTEPLWRVRGSAPEARNETVCEAGCGGGFDPFGWLLLLFGEGGGGRPDAGQPEPRPAEPASADDGPGADGLRTGEAVARIWIAPFVDADGVYREASWVRVVLEPAGWRLK